ncbi:trypsin-like serine protease [Skeletonema marinoi]|uniref:Trypsin-like serine protease n=1 Tax=Skeletonema marinoi TaxID=267567 RepID=A0AAD8Y9G6_9STRA|nr:trypsin-like serine protease [Skeletonema marinoi]
MCAYMEVEGGPTGTCQGDSGGPIVIASQNVGITSWGVGCGQKGYPDYYTRVSSYIDWIEETACAKVGELCSSSKSGKSSRSGCGNSKASKSQVLPSVSAEEDVAAVHDEMNV